MWLTSHRCSTALRAPRLFTDRRAGERLSRAETRAISVIRNVLQRKIQTSHLEITRATEILMMCKYPHETITSHRARPNSQYFYCSRSQRNPPTALNTLSCAMPMKYNPLARLANDHCLDELRHGTWPGHHKGFSPRSGRTFASLHKTQSDSIRTMGGRGHALPSWIAEGHLSTSVRVRGWPQACTVPGTNSHIALIEY